MRLRTRLAAVTAILLLAGDAAAQSPPAGLRRRMDAFSAALRNQAPKPAIAGFFPRDSAWEMVHAPHRQAPGATIRTTRVAPDRTLAEISEGGGLCYSFDGGTVEARPADNTLTVQAMDHPRPWRYVGRQRFVPRGARDGSPVWVEWRRERGTWVVSRVGEEYRYVPRVIGETTEHDPSRDTTAGNELPLEQRVAAGTSWYRDHEPITFVGRRFVKYGLTRMFSEGELVRYGSVGVVPVFVDRGQERRAIPPVIYLLAAPGEYQPYQTFGLFCSG
jgi:hypothetical protein